jgi:co-chaperonin GroES (HSP10)
LDDNARRVPMSVKASDKILFAKCNLPYKRSEIRGEEAKTRRGDGCASSHPRIFAARNGHLITYTKYGGTEYKVGDVEYLILSEKDILGVIQE